MTQLQLDPARYLGGAASSVRDGSICLEFAPEDRAAFFRFSVE